MKHLRRTLATLLVLAAGSTATLAGKSAAQQAIQDGYAAAARAADPAFKGFSAERGKAFFHAKHGGGKPETPSCTTCHTSDPTAAGKSRAGKTIAPMAASRSPERFSDQKQVEKWFRRNCSDVLGRACTASEKGDVLAYLLSL
ncbi:MAG: DUF1924 domain-containing protein [Hyphomicrobiaceae bacterium]